MRDAIGMSSGRPGLVGLAVVAVVLGTPLTAAGAERMVLGEYFTATW